MELATVVPAVETRISSVACASLPGGTFTSTKREVTISIESVRDEMRNEIG